MRWIGVLILLGILGVMGTLGGMKNDELFPKYPHKTLVIGSHSIEVAIADTPERREVGLSGIDKIEPNQGLLFKFDAPGHYAFWMKDMLISIDMIFLDLNLKVVEVAPRLSPDTYPQQFSSKIGEYLYVLEIGAGEASKLGLKEGQVLLLSSSRRRGSRIVTD